jgi:hypothetical protein
MRKLVVFGIVLVVMGIGVAAWLPRAAFSRLKDALRTGSKADLEDTIDFEALRRSLKDEMAAGFVDAVREKGKDGGAGQIIGAALGAAFAEKVGGALVDACVTPAGLARLASGESPSTVSENQAGSVGDLFAGAIFEHRSMSTFVVRVPEQRGGESEFVLRRDGLAWRLSAIHFRRSQR